MRRLLAFVAFVLLFAAPIAAQLQVNGTFIGFIDRVIAVGGPQSMTLIRIEGWGFDPTTGDTPGGGTGVIVLDGEQVPAAFHYGLSRPDVAHAYAGLATAPRTGFYAELYAQSGTHQVNGFFGTRNGAYFINTMIRVP